MENGEGYHSARIGIPLEFEDVFTYFYTAANNSGKAITKTLLPSYQTMLIFNFGTAASLQYGQGELLTINKCLVAGPVKQAFEYILPPGTEILVANFKDDAFYRFFGNATVAEHLPLDPDELLNENCFTALWQEIKKIDDADGRINRILDFCRPYLKQRNEISGQLANVKEQELDPIKIVAALTNQTERNIQLNHKKTFGYSAKEIHRYQRFIRAIEFIQKIACDNKKMDWFEVIHECGYYDQSQLIHDFRHYLHLTPVKYLKFQQDICGGKNG